MADGTTNIHSTRVMSLLQLTLCVDLNGSDLNHQSNTKRNEEVIEEVIVQL